MYTITILHLGDGCFRRETLAKLPISRSLDQVRKRLSEVAKKEFGEYAVHVQDSSMLGYWKHDITGQTINVHHEKWSD